MRTPLIRYDTDGIQANYWDQRDIKHAGHHAIDLSRKNRSSHKSWRQQPQDDKPRRHFRRRGRKRVVNPHARRVKVRVRPRIKSRGVQNEIAMNGDVHRMSQTSPSAEYCRRLRPIMRRIPDPPPRQPQRHKQRPNPRHPLLPPPRIRLLDDPPPIPFPLTRPTIHPHTSPHPPIPPPRIPTHQKHKTPQHQIHRNDIHAPRAPGMDLAGHNGRQEHERHVPSGQHGRRDEQRKGQEGKGDEVAVGAGAGDDVCG